MNISTRKSTEDCTTFTLIRVNNQETTRKREQSTKALKDRATKMIKNVKLYNK